MTHQHIASHDRKVVRGGQGFANCIAPTVNGIMNETVDVGCVIGAGADGISATVPKWKPAVSPPPFPAPCLLTSGLKRSLFCA